MFQKLVHCVRKIRGTFIGTAVTCDDHVLKNLCSTHMTAQTSSESVSCMPSVCFAVLVCNSKHDEIVYLCPSTQPFR
jgi:hypothetical protein